MESSIVRRVISNLRDPLDLRVRVKFTSRSIKLLTLLFDGKHLDAIDLHTMFLRMAHNKGCFQEDTYINLKDVVTYLSIDTNSVATLHDIKAACSMFDINHDNQYYEVKDMYSILNSLCPN